MSLKIYQLLNKLHFYKCQTQSNIELVQPGLY